MLAINETATTGNSDGEAKQNSKITEDQAVLLLQDHRNDLVSLDAPGNLPLFHVEGLSYTARLRLHATWEFALIESQARIQSLLLPKDSSLSNPKHEF